MFLRTHSRSDVRTNEQYNSLVRQINERCRNISLSLLSARVNLKKMLGVGCRGAKMRWSSVRPKAEALLSTLMQHADQAHSLVAEPGRWEVPPPIPVAGNVNDIFNVCSPLDGNAASKWAAAFSLKLHACCPEPSATQLIVMTVPEMGQDWDDDQHTLSDASDHGGVGYFVAEKNYSTARLIKCTLSVDATVAPPKLVAKICVPVEVVSSIELFPSCYDVFYNSDVDEELAMMMKIAVSSHALQWRFEWGVLFGIVSAVGSLLFPLCKTKPKDPRRNEGAGAPGGGNDEAEAPPAEWGAQGQDEDPVGVLMDIDDDPWADDGEDDAAAERVLSADANGFSEADDQWAEWKQQDRADTSEDLVRKFEQRMVDAILRVETAAPSSSSNAHAAQAQDVAGVDLDAELESVVLESLAFRGSSLERDRGGDGAAVAQVAAAVVSASHDASSASSSSSAPRPPALDVDRVLREWEGKVVAGVALLERSMQARAVLSLGRTDMPPWELSLMAPPDDDPSAGSVCLVQWSYIPSRKGRPVRPVRSLKDPNVWEGLWPTAALIRETSFDRWTIVHPAVGVVLKRSQEQRSTIPGNIMDLLHMWESARAGGHMCQLLDECVACGLESSAASPVVTCPLCMCSWHNGCCAKVFSHADAQHVCERLKVAEVPIPWLPNLFVHGPCRGDGTATAAEAAPSPMCTLCRAVCHV